MSLIINTPFVCPEQHWVEGKGGKLRTADYKLRPSQAQLERLVGRLVEHKRKQLEQIPSKVQEQQAPQHEARPAQGASPNVVGGSVDAAPAVAKRMMDTSDMEPDRSMRLVEFLSIPIQAAPLGVRGASLARPTDRRAPTVQ